MKKVIAGGEAVVGKSYDREVVGSILVAAIFSGRAYREPYDEEVFFAASIIHQYR